MKTHSQAAESRWVSGFVLVEFDLKEGPFPAYYYSCATNTSDESESKSLKISDAILSQIAMQSFPDTISANSSTAIDSSFAFHVFPSDIEHFQEKQFLPENVLFPFSVASTHDFIEPSSSSLNTLHCHSFFMQRPNPSNPRGYTQRALVLISTLSAPAMLPQLATSVGRLLFLMVPPLLSRTVSTGASTGTTAHATAASASPRAALKNSLSLSVNEDDFVDKDVKDNHTQESQVVSSIFAHVIAHISTWPSPTETLVGRRYRNLNPSGENDHTSPKISSADFPVYTLALPLPLSSPQEHLTIQTHLKYTPIQPIPSLSSSPATSSVLTPHALPLPLPPRTLPPPTLPLYTLFGPRLVPHLVALWCRVLLRQSILVFTLSPAIAAMTTQTLEYLCYPFPSTGLIQPLLTTYDKHMNALIQDNMLQDYKDKPHRPSQNTPKLNNLSPQPQSIAKSQGTSAPIMGLTNPFFLRLLPPPACVLSPSPLAMPLSPDNGMPVRIGRWSSACETRKVTTSDGSAVTGVEVDESLSLEGNPSVSGVSPDQRQLFQNTTSRPFATSNTPHLVLPSSLLPLGTNSPLMALANHLTSTFSTTSANTSHLASVAQPHDASPHTAPPRMTHSLSPSQLAQTVTLLLTALFSPAPPPPPPLLTAAHLAPSKRHSPSHKRDKRGQWACGELLEAVFEVKPAPAQAYMPAELPRDEVMASTGASGGVGGTGAGARRGEVVATASVAAASRSGAGNGNRDRYTSNSNTVLTTATEAETSKSAFGFFKKLFSRNSAVDNNSQSSRNNDLSIPSSGNSSPAGNDPITIPHLHAPPALLAYPTVPLKASPPALPFKLKYVDGECQCVPNQDYRESNRYNELHYAESEEEDDDNDYNDVGSLDVSVAIVEDEYCEITQSPRVSSTRARTRQRNQLNGKYSRDDSNPRKTSTRSPREAPFAYSQDSASEGQEYGWSRLFYRVDDAPTAHNRSSSQPQPHANSEQRSQSSFSTSQTPSDPPSPSTTSSVPVSSSMSRLIEPGTCSFTSTLPLSVLSHMDSILTQYIRSLTEAFFEPLLRHVAVPVDMLSHRNPYLRVPTMPSFDVQAFLSSLSREKLAPLLKLLPADSKSLKRVRALYALFCVSPACAAFLKSLAEYSVLAGRTACHHGIIGCCSRPRASTHDDNCEKIEDASHDVDPHIHDERCCGKALRARIDGAHIREVIRALVIAKTELAALDAATDGITKRLPTNEDEVNSSGTAVSTSHGVNVVPSVVTLRSQIKAHVDTLEHAVHTCLGTDSDHTLSNSAQTQRGTDEVLQHNSSVQNPLITPSQGNCGKDGEIHVHPESGAAVRRDSAEMCVLSSSVRQEDDSVRWGSGICSINHEGLPQTWERFLAIPRNTVAVSQDPLLSEYLSLSLISGISDSVSSMQAVQRSHLSDNVRRGIGDQSSLRVSTLPDDIMTRDADDTYNRPKKNYVSFGREMMFRFHDDHF